MIQAYTGDGKGKTTAALGLAVRAAGRGLRVVFIQFLKESERGRNDSKTLGALGLNITTRTFGEDMLESVSEDKKRKIAARVAEGLVFAREQLAGKADVVILDEISHAVNLGLCKEDEVISLVNGALPEVELILTGRNMSPALLNRADLVTEMRNIKHPYDKGVNARYGIEY